VVLCKLFGSLANFSQFVAFLFGIFPRNLFIFVWLELFSVIVGRQFQLYKQQSYTISVRRAANFSQFAAFLFGIFPRSLFVFSWPLIFKAIQFLAF